MLLPTLFLKRQARCWNFGTLYQPIPWVKLGAVEAVILRTFDCEISMFHWLSCEFQTALLFLPWKNWQHSLHSMEFFDEKEAVSSILPHCLQNLVPCVGEKGKQLKPKFMLSIFGSAFSMRFCCFQQFKLRMFPFCLFFLIECSFNIEIETRNHGLFFSKMRFLDWIGHDVFAMEQWLVIGAVLIFIPNLVELYRNFLTTWWVQLSEIRNFQDFMLNSKGFMGSNLSLAPCRTVNVKRGDTADQLCWGLSVVSGEHLQGFLKNVWVCVGVVQILHISKDVNTSLYRHKCKYVFEYANALCICICICIRYSCLHLYL